MSHLASDEIVTTDPTLTDLPLLRPPYPLVTCCISIPVLILTPDPCHFPIINLHQQNSTLNTSTLTQSSRLLTDLLPLPDSPSTQPFTSAQERKSPTLYANSLPPITTTLSSYPDTYPSHISTHFYPHFLRIFLLSLVLPLPGNSAPIILSLMISGPEIKIMKSIVLFIRGH